MSKEDEFFEGYTKFRESLFNFLNDIFMNLLDSVNIKYEDFVSEDEVNTFEVTFKRAPYFTQPVVFRGKKYIINCVYSIDGKTTWRYNLETLNKGQNIIPKTSKVIYIPGSKIKDMTSSELHTYIKNLKRC